MAATVADWLRWSASCGYTAKNRITATTGTRTSASPARRSRELTPVPTRLCMVRMNMRSM